ncbi:MAG: MBL fold metallo-hydrolase, partial [Proteobacteria bacterium]|nr:MBL fold metallo-hydrolase [Pseudomonadota bacterium]
MRHIVSQAAEPFLAHNGQLEVHQVYAAHDNVIWIFRCLQTGETAVVDGPDASSVLQYTEANELTPTMILNTHTHGDHIGINFDLMRRGLLGDLRVVGRGAVPGLTQEVSEGAQVRLGESVGRVMLTEGHLDNHVSYVFGDLLFCGDALFGGGCGRLFRGRRATEADSKHRFPVL